MLVAEDNLCADRGVFPHSGNAGDQGCENFHGRFDLSMDSCNEIINASWAKLNGLVMLNKNIFQTSVNLRIHNTVGMIGFWVWHTIYYKAHHDHFTFVTRNVKTNTRTTFDVHIAFTFLIKHHDTCNAATKFRHIDVQSNAWTPTTNQLWQSIGDGVKLNDIHDSI